MCQLVIFGCLTLIWKFDLNFGRNKFSKHRIDLVMLKFLPKTENQKLIWSEDSNH